jgi:hypothetical protein
MSSTHANPEVFVLSRRLCDAATEKRDFATPKSRDHALFDTIKEAIAGLLALGEPGLTELNRLLDHESPHVRLWVGTQLLIDGSSKAKDVLEVVASGTDLVAFGARMTLDQFDNGRLTSFLHAHDA